MTRTYRGRPGPGPSRKAQAPKPPDTHGMDHRQKAKGLVELALDESTSESERSSAALKAVALIDKYDLLTLPPSPFDVIGGNNETVQAVRDVVDKIPEIKKSFGTIMRGFEGVLGGRRR